MEKTYEKYLKQGSGDKYDEDNPKAPKKAPEPGWITYAMNEEDWKSMSLMHQTIDSAKRMGVKIKPDVFKKMKTELNALKKLLPNLEKDIKAKDIDGVRSSISAINYSVQTIYNAI